MRCRYGVDVHTVLRWKTTCAVKGKRSALSQQALARRCGLTRQAINAIEAGHYTPNTAVALRLASVLGCTVEELFRLPEHTPRVEAELFECAAGSGTGRTRLQVARVGSAYWRIP